MRVLGISGLYHDSAAALVVDGAIAAAAQEEEFEEGEEGEGIGLSLSALEEKLKLSQYIANVMVHGANRPYNVALIVPDMAELREWAKRPENGITDPSDEVAMFTWVPLIV